MDVIASIPTTPISYEFTAFLGIPCELVVIPESLEASELANYKPAKPAT